MEIILSVWTAIGFSHFPWKFLMNRKFLLISSWYVFLVHFLCQNIGNKACVLNIIRESGHMQSKIVNYTMFNLLIVDSEICFWLAIFSCRNWISLCTESLVFKMRKWLTSFYITTCLSLLLYIVTSKLLIFLLLHIFFHGLRTKASDGWEYKCFRLQLNVDSMSVAVRWMWEIVWIYNVRFNLLDYR